MSMWDNCCTQCGSPKFDYCDGCPCHISDLGAKHKYPDSFKSEAEQETNEPRV